MLRKFCSNEMWPPTAHQSANEQTAQQLGHATSPTKKKQLSVNHHNCPPNYYITDRQQVPPPATYWTDTTPREPTLADLSPVYETIDSDYVYQTELHVHSDPWARQLRPQLLSAAAAAGPQLDQFQTGFNQLVTRDSSGQLRSAVQCCDVAKSPGKLLLVGSDGSLRVSRGCPSDIGWENRGPASDNRISASDSRYSPLTSRGSTSQSTSNTKRLPINSSVGQTAPSLSGSRRPLSSYLNPLKGPASATNGEQDSGSSEARRVQSFRTTRQVDRSRHGVLRQPHGINLPHLQLTLCLEDGPSSSPITAL